MTFWCHLSKGEAKPSVRNGDNGQKRTTPTTNSSASAYGFCETIDVVTSGNEGRRVP